MYKTKITQWRLQKNYKAQERQVLLHFLEELEPPALGAGCFEIRGRPAKMDRIFRYSRERGIVRADAGRVHVSHPIVRAKRQTIKLTRLQHQGLSREELLGSLSPPVHLSPCLSGPQDQQDAEILMYDAAQYYQSYFSPEDRFGKGDLLRWKPFFDQFLLVDIAYQYITACRSASQSFYRAARIHLDRACRHLRLAMLAQHSRLLGTIFCMVRTRSRNADFETADIFGRFAADMATAIHGETHPITRSIQRFCRSIAPKDALLAAFHQIRLASAREILSDTHRETINLAIALCYGFKEDTKQKFEASFAEGFEKAESNYGPCANETLRALLNRAGLYLMVVRDLTGLSQDMPRY